MATGARTARSTCGCRGLVASTHYDTVASVESAMTDICTRITVL